MFVGLTTRLKNASGFRLGAGIRVTKKNAVVMLWIVFFVLMFQLMFKMMIFAFWGMCYMFYGLFLCYKYMYLGAAWLVKKAYHFIKSKVQKSPDGATEGRVDL